MTTKLIDRTMAPALQVPEQVVLGEYKTHTLQNGVPVYYTENHTEDVVKIELCFPAGRWYEPGPMVSRAVCRLLTKGTSEYSSKELADRIDFYGASVETANGHDHTSVKIFTLGKYLSEILPLVRLMLEDASFPEEEFILFQRKQIQKWQVGLQNTDFVANRTFHEVLFGARHPYGYSVDDTIIHQLDLQVLSEFSHRHYQPSNAQVFLSGHITEEVLKLLETHLGQGNPAVKQAAVVPALATSDEQKFLVSSDSSVQSSVRIGGITIGKDHADFPALNVANTVLGGYFGSRLMSNIREDKGYTYGIYSMLRHHRHVSYFAVDTEVGNEVCRHAVEEIGKEMALLGKEPVGMDELTVVRNYMMGSLIRATDGSFNRIQVIRNMVLSDLDFSYFSKLADAVRNTDPERIMELAQTYLQPDDMMEVICGNPDK